MLLGYACVSTDDQNLDLQNDAVAKKTTHGSLDTVLIYTKFAIRKLRSDFPDLIDGNSNYEKLLQTGNIDREHLFFVDFVNC